MIICEKCKHIHDKEEKCITILPGKYESCHATTQDMRCFNCNHFLGCNEPGDILCNKDEGVLKRRDKLTIIKCNKNKWYKDIGEQYENRNNKYRNLL